MARDIAATMIDPFLVWSNQHRAWWRQDSAGYATDIREAGHYSREEAISISGKARDGWGEPTETPDELAIPISALPENIRLAVRRAATRERRLNFVNGS